MRVGLSRRGLVRGVAFALAATAALGGLALQRHHQANAYKTQLQYGYSRALEELTANLSNLCTTLEKGVYANDAAYFSSLSAQLLQSAGTAKTALSMLPPAGEELTVVHRFLSQVGDYAMYLSQKNVSGEVPTQPERENLQALSRVANSLSQNMEEIRQRYDQEGVWDAELHGEFTSSGFGEQLAQVEQTLTDYPTLVYDGPFSDHILEGTSKLLQAAPQVEREQARQVAAKAMGLQPQQLQDEPDEAGKMPCYGFATDTAVAAVTQAGGYLVYFRNYRPIGEHRLSYPQAVNVAKDYLNQQGKNSFVDTYYFADEGMCVVNFAHKEGATLCYPDLVKIGVALDTGEVVFYEGRGYLMNHSTRTIPTPKHTQAEAQEMLSANLTVQRVQQVVVPTPGNEERLCYEFLCTGAAGEELLVYIRTDTLQEQQILLLLKTDGGTLTK